MGDLPEFRAGVLSVMRELIPAEIASYNEISREPPPRSLSAIPTTHSARSRRSAVSSSRS